MGLCKLHVCWEIRQQGQIKQTSVAQKFNPPSSIMNTEIVCKCESNSRWCGSVSLDRLILTMHQWLHMQHHLILRTCHYVAQFTVDLFMLHRSMQTHTTCQHPALHIEQHHRLCGNTLFLSSRQHLNNNDCLEDKNEDYQNYSVLYCVLQGAWWYQKLIQLTRI